jgi:hypothetical protein
MVENCRVAMRIHFNREELNQYFFEVSMHIGKFPKI